MNEEKFTGKADLYEKYRPTYPKELIDWLYDNANAKVVADIGAGTGKFTQCLAEKPWKITAVEPNADMRSKLNIEGVEVVNGTAENTGLLDNSVDLVTAAQAFHWFDKDNFKAECMRILKPAGSLAIVYNERKSIDDFTLERDDIFKKYCGKAKVRHICTDSDEEGEEYLKSGFFTEVKTFALHSDKQVDLEGFIGRELSSSVALKEDNPKYAEFRRELENIFYKYQKDGKLTIKTVSVCYLGKF